MSSEARRVFAQTQIQRILHMKSRSHFVTQTHRSLVAFALISTWTVVLQATPHIPKSDDEVLTRLTTTLSRSDSAELRRMRFSEKAAQKNLPAAVDLARKLIQLARAEADPRYLYQAQTALASWWTLEEPPIEVLLLRATIRQSLHDFEGALTDLDQLLHRDPQNGQGWLTRAVVLTVRGKYDAAREACLQSMRFTDPLAATTVTAALGGAIGRADGAYQLLAHALDSAAKTSTSNRKEPVAVRVWALITLGELAERRGLLELALGHFESALALAPKDKFALAARADVLLAQGKPHEVCESLQSYERIDALMLRLAEANKQLAAREPDRQAELDRQIKLLGERFDSARLRGNALHRREEARFQLHLKNNPKRALELARVNWTVQKEWADSQILIESAEAAGDLKTVHSIQAWLKNPNDDSVAQTARASLP